LTLIPNPKPQTPNPKPQTPNPKGSDGKKPLGRSIILLDGAVENKAGIALTFVET